MVTSKRVSNAKSEKYNGNIHKRGKVEMKEVGGPRKSKISSSVGPVLLGFFVFVVVGSALLQIVRTATSGAPGL